jgi:hypothetical protein
MKRRPYACLARYLRITQAHLHTSLKHTHDVELLNKIQFLMEDISLAWTQGRPLWNDNKLEQDCGCAHTQAKKDLLQVLMNEYDKRMYQPEDTRRMHATED